MLTITGKTLDVTQETIQGPNGSFVKTTIHLLDGVSVTAVVTGRDFPTADLPKKDEQVTLSVVVSAFARKAGGAGVQFTALNRVGARAAAGV